MKYIRIKNWKELQHYKDRCPPWIKLYNRLLSDYEFSRLPDASKLQLILVWLLASQMDNKIPADSEWIKSKIMVSGKVDLQPMIKAGFIELYQDDGTLLADCVQDDIPEREEKRGKEDSSLIFDNVWNLYPNKAGKQRAKKGFDKAIKAGVDVAIIVDGVERYKAYVAAQRKGGFKDLKYQNGATWFCNNGWEDEYTISEPERKGRVVL
jgi:hypothetical protein